MEVGLSPGDFVFDGDPALPPKKGAEPPPQFSTQVCCGKTAGWIKVALGMEVGLGSGHIVLDGEPAPLRQKGAKPPIFGPFLMSLNGWMDQDGTWYEGRPQPRRLSVRWGPIFPFPKGAQSPQFSADVCRCQTTEWNKCLPPFTGRVHGRYEAV